MVTYSALTYDLLVADIDTGRIWRYVGEDPATAESIEDPNSWLLAFGDDFASYELVPGYALLMPFPDDPAPTQQATVYIDYSVSDLEDPVPGLMLSIDGGDDVVVALAPTEELVQQTHEVVLPAEWLPLLAGDVEIAVTLDDQAERLAIDNLSVVLVRDGFTYYWDGFQWVLLATGGQTLSSHNQLTGRELDNAHPISAITGLQTALDVIDTKADRFSAKQDHFTLTSSTPSLVLSWVPMADSEHFYLNGVYQFQGVDWEKHEEFDHIIKPLPAMDAQAGDVVSVEYLYETAQPPPPVWEPEIPNLPYIWLKLDEADAGNNTPLTDLGTQDAFNWYRGSLGQLGAPALVWDGGSAVRANGESNSSTGPVIYTSRTDRELANPRSQGVWVKISGPTTRIGLSSPSIGATWRSWFMLGGEFVTHDGDVNNGPWVTNIPCSEIIDGQPHLIATTLSGSTLKTYIDGVLRYTESNCTQNPMFESTTGGSKLYGPDGTVFDDFCAWERVLSDQEMADWYAGGPL